MTFVVDAAHMGTPASVWASSAHLAGVPPLLLRPRKVVLLAPHPDDEVLGAGGLIQALVADGVDLHIVAVTDGEASHPKSVVASGLDLGTLRSIEAKEALRRLGWLEPLTTRLKIPDGRVAENMVDLQRVLTGLLAPDDICVAPWWRDGHPDHDACGRAALAAGHEIGARTLGYLVWAWHWAHPDGSDIPWASCRRLDMTSRRAARKRWATGAFRSQTRPLGPSPEDAPVLPAPVLRRFWQHYEIFIEASAPR
jgi:LmbE family N-acetylglucosaminyl deacetylase